MGSAHVIAVPLGADPFLLSPLVVATDRQGCGRCGTICGDRCVFIYNAAERPAGTGVL